MNCKLKQFKRLTALFGIMGVLFSCVVGCAAKTPEPTETPKPDETAFYVSADGSDEADGSEATPFATPQKGC